METPRRVSIIYFHEKKNMSLYLTIDIFLMENNGGGDHFSLVHKNTSAGTNAWNSDLQVSEIPWRHGEMNQFLPIFGHIPGTTYPIWKSDFGYQHSVIKHNNNTVYYYCTQYRAVQKKPKNIGKNVSLSFFCEIAWHEMFHVWCREFF